MLVATSHRPGAAIVKESRTRKVPAAPGASGLCRGAKLLVRTAKPGTPLARGCRPPPRWRGRASRLRRPVDARPFLATVPRTNPGCLLVSPAMLRTHAPREARLALEKALELASELRYL